MNVIYYFGTSAPLQKHHYEREIPYLNAIAKEVEKIIVISPDENEEYIEKNDRKFIYKKAPTNKIMYNMFLFLDAFKKDFREVDVVYCRFINALLPAIIAKLIAKNKPGIITGYRWRWGETAYRNGNIIAGTIKKMCEKTLLKKADRVTVPTQQLKEFLCKEYGIETVNVKIVPNFVPIEQFPGKGTYKILGKTLKVIAVGRLHQDKNYILMINALAEAQGIINREIELTIIGSGGLRDKIEAFAREREIKINIVNYVPNHEIHKKINEHDIYINTSRTEGHPKAVLEALCCGVPCIVTDVPGNNVVVEHQKNGLICDEKSSTIADAIKKLNNDEGLRALLGRNGREYIVNNCNFDKVVKMETDAITNW